MTRVRFAPSPTGELHLGNIRTALFNYLFAKHQQGVCVLRIEDTDKDRSTQNFEDSIYTDLAWLGLEFEESPQAGGAYGPYRQSERSMLYREYLEKLQAQGKVYPCYCTPEELEAEKIKALNASKTPKYSGKCRQLTSEQKEKLLAEGRKPSIRFHLTPQVVKFHDLVYGDKSFDTNSMGDFVIFRSNGDPVYLFASALDDYLMKITHVIRGEDGMSNTPRQIALFQAWGVEAPQYGHLPLILGPDRQLLSKRHGSTSVAALKQEGYLKEAVVNYVALLGWAPEDTQEIMSLSEMTQKFNLSRVGRSSAIFDFEKMKHLNKHYLDQLSPEQFCEAIKPHLQAKLGELANNAFEVALASRHNGRTLVEITNVVAIILQRPQAFPEELKNILVTPEAKKVLLAYKQVIETIDSPFGDESYAQTIEKVKAATKAKGKGLFMPFRIALTGASEGPELANLFKLFPKTEILQRLDNATLSL